MVKFVTKGFKGENMLIWLSFYMLISATIIYFFTKELIQLERKNYKLWCFIMSLLFGPGWAIMFISLYDKIKGK